MPPARAGQDAEPDLLSFHSREVEAVQGGGFRAVGMLAGAKGKKKTEVSVETPPGHTALVVVSFAAKKQDFGDGWHDLLANIASDLRRRRAASVTARARVVDRATAGHRLTDDASSCR